jgi:BirA family transcriptional regulator, biotin operon repressor / biotin---[acetyl-CoA-carboxylase] ligase
MTVLDKVLLNCLNDGPVSGVDIAKHLGISRSAVWKRIEMLRQQGLEILAVAGKGYALQYPLDFLDHVAIKTALDAKARACLGTLAIVEQVDSTNAWAHKTPLSRASSADIFLAEQQLAGRGRRGRTWASPYASNIYLSIHQCFDRPLASLSGLSLLVGLTIVKTLRDMQFSTVSVKWPNDIVADQKKCGGILIEVQGDAQGPVIATIGIGLNVRMPHSAGGVIDQAWTDLHQLSPIKRISRNALVANLLNRLLPALQNFEKNGAADDLQQWPQYDALLNKAVRVIDGNQEHHGIAVGVTDHGALRVLQDGIEKQYHSGEVSVRVST